MSRARTRWEIGRLLPLPPLPPIPGQIWVMLAPEPRGGSVSGESKLQVRRGRGPEGRCRGGLITPKLSMDVTALSSHGADGVAGAGLEGVRVLDAGRDGAGGEVEGGPEREGQGKGGSRRRQMRAGM